MQKPCSCDFLHGEETSVDAVSKIKEALTKGEESQVEITYYKKDGKSMLIEFNSSCYFLHTLLRKMNAARSVTLDDFECDIGF